MGTILSTGLSTNHNSTAAAKEALLQAKNKMGESRVDLSIIYSSKEYDYREVVDTIRAGTNNAPLIGASSAGEFNEEKVETGSIAVGLLSSDDIKIYNAWASGIKQDHETAIREIAAKLPSKVEGYPYLTAILHIDGLSGVGEEITLLASYLLSNEIKIVGGMAGDDFKMEKTFVFCDDDISTNAVCVCLLASKKPLFTGIKHGHKPLSKSLKVTRAQGNILYEINDRPAWEVWKEETAVAALKKGIDVEQLIDPQQIAQFFTKFILGLATDKKDAYKIRWPVSINNDGSFNFACGIAQGAVFHIMDGSDLEDHINAPKEAVRMARRFAHSAGYEEYAGILVFDCAVRQLMLQDRFCEGIDQIKKTLPDVPILGWETYGEIRMESGQFSGFHNTTSVILLLPK
ncbi:MAG: FIST C-terminal domain-containing protein [Methanosarcinales archaeon]|nr:FIST C-terminal domain-containing protein [Methanosarcinales archaeon]